MPRKFLIAVVFVGLSIFQPVLYGCTTFFMEGHGILIFGRNYDWDVPYCLIMVNKRNMAKQAFVEKNPLKWVAKYGSVTFNQYGREFPLEGVNEAGLVIACSERSSRRIERIAVDSVSA